LIDANDSARRQFGDFEIDLQAGKLLRGGQAVKIQPQPLRVLALLTERPGEIVSREELRSRVWGDSMYVEFDQGLNYCVRQIRLALRDDAGHPNYLETLPKQGYRFIAEVRCTSEESQKTAIVSVTVEAADSLSVSPPSAKASRKLPLRVTFMAATMVVLAGMGIWSGVARRESLPRPLDAVRLTRLPVVETDPAFSPDGRSIAFSWNGEKEDNYDIYVTPAGSAAPSRLTWDLGNDMSPAWSPDGRRIAFLRVRSISKGSLVMVPSTGGPERVLRDVVLDENVYRAMRPLLTWVPDGSGIIYTAVDPESGRSNLYLTNLQGTIAHKLFAPGAEGTLGSASPAFTPDGKWIAFTEVYGPFQARLLARPVSPGLRFSTEPIRISGPEDTLVGSPVWAPTGNRLLYRQDAAVFEWKPGENARQLYVTSAGLGGMSASWDPGKRGAGDKPRIVTAQPPYKEFHIVPLRPGGLSIAGNPAAFVASSSGQGNPQFSPDGKSFLFISWRSGRGEVWMTDAEGRNPRQLTRINATMIGHARWSGDSRRIAFHTWIGNKPQIHTIDLHESLVAGVYRTKKITDSAVGFSMDSWSADGKYLYVNRATGGARIFRVPVDGGPPEDLFEGATGMVTSDGHSIVYGKLGRSGLFQRSLDGDPATNAEEKLVDDYRAPGVDLNPFPEGVYYMSWNGEGKPRAVRFYSYANKKSMDIISISGTFRTPVGLAVSPDRRRLVYNLLSGTGTDLTLIEFQ